MPYEHENKKFRFIEIAARKQVSHSVAKVELKLNKITRLREVAIAELR